MKVKLIMATEDNEYSNHFYNYLSEKYAEDFDIRICSTQESFLNTTLKNKFDVALIDSEFTQCLNNDNVKISLSLFDNFNDNTQKSAKMIYKYQRISKIVSNILEECSVLENLTSGMKNGLGNVTVVWSPCGGVGKTTVSLAYATRKTIENKNVIYLNLEKFSSINTYFPNSQSSISTIFRKINENLELVIKSVKQTDTDSKISYFGAPENYDDLNAVTQEDISKIIKACAENSDELVIDFSSVCDDFVKSAFDIADRILIVTDNTTDSSTKLNQFLTQNNIWENIKDKSGIVANKGANIQNSYCEVYNLTRVRSQDPINIYKTLSSENFER